MRLLDHFERLIRDPKTQEMDVHKVIEKTWILGPEYTLVNANQTLASALGNYLDSKFAKSRAKKRPDLFLGLFKQGKYLLIEFKRPSMAITREHEIQAATYRDDLTRRYGDMDLLLLGKERSTSTLIQYDSPNMKVFGFERSLPKRVTSLSGCLKN